MTSRPRPTPAGAPLPPIRVEPCPADLHKLGKETWQILAETLPLQGVKDMVDMSRRAIKELERDLERIEWFSEQRHGQRRVELSARKWERLRQVTAILSALNRRYLRSANPDEVWTFMKNLAQQLFRECAEMSARPEQAWIDGFDIFGQYGKFTHRNYRNHEHTPTIAVLELLEHPLLTGKTPNPIAVALMDELLLPAVDLKEMVNGMLRKLAPFNEFYKSGRSRDADSSPLEILLRHFSVSLSELEIYEVLNYWLVNPMSTANSDFACLLALIPESEIPGTSTITVKELLPFAACCPGFLETLVGTYKISTIEFMTLTLCGSQLSDEAREDREFWRLFVRTHPSAARFCKVLFRNQETSIGPCTAEEREDWRAMLPQDLDLGCSTAVHEARLNRFVPSLRTSCRGVWCLRHFGPEILGWIDELPEWTQFSSYGRRPPGRTIPIPTK
jgi:hypothetical protein